jgi:hypothetical protein
VEKIPDCSRGSVSAMPSRVLAAITAWRCWKDRGRTLEVASLEPGEHFGHVRFDEGGGMEERGEERLGSFDPMRVVGLPFRARRGGEGVGPGDGLVPDLAADERRPAQLGDAGRGGGVGGGVPQPAAADPQPDCGGGGHDVGFGGPDDAASGWVYRAGTISRLVSPDPGRADDQGVVFGAGEDRCPGPVAEVDPRLHVA